MPKIKFTKVVEEVIEGIVVEWRHIKPNQCSEKSYLSIIVFVFAKKLKKNSLTLNKIARSHNSHTYLITINNYRKKILINNTMIYSKIVVELSEIIISIPSLQLSPEILTPIQETEARICFQNIVQNKVAMKTRL